MVVSFAQVVQSVKNNEEKKSKSGLCSMIDADGHVKPITSLEELLGFQPSLVDADYLSHLKR